MKPLKLVTIVVLGLTFCTGAEPAPKWIVDLKSLGIPASRPEPEFTDRALTIAFSASNEVLVSFVRHGLGTRQLLDSPTELVALLLDAANGKIITRHEWPTQMPPTPRIARLPGGGFVALFRNHLQVLDGSLMPVQEKTLELTLSGRPVYFLTVPVKGRFFGVNYSNLPRGSPVAQDFRITQIIDSQTLTVAEEWKTPDHAGGVADIYEDRVLAGRFESRQEKRIGQTWHPFGAKIPQKILEGHFLNSDLAMVMTIDTTAGREYCWSEADESAVHGKPVCYPQSDRVDAVNSSQDGSVIAVGIIRQPTGFRALLDLNSEGRVLVYAQGTHRKLLTVPPIKFGYQMALSSDGSLLAVLHSEDLAVYSVPHP